jgi:N6-adenosine-specific RNA methylase IME4
MPVGDLMKEDSHVWLWVTNGTLRAGYEVLEAWGYTPRSTYTWCKINSGLGLGVYLRNNTEYVLFGTRGKAPILCKNQPSFGIFPTQGHSHKPEEFHKIVERCSPGPYVELFARRKYPGWDVWGNEIESDLELKGYPVPNSPATRKLQEPVAKTDGGDNA